MQDADAIVFVVDDDSSIREAIKSLVSLVGLRVETFGSAQEFLRYERPDLAGRRAGRLADAERGLRECLLRRAG